MSALGLEVFDKTVQTTNVWLDEICERLGPDRHRAWHVLGAVLRALRNRMPIELEAHLGAQLPLLIRGAYYDQWRPDSVPEKWRTLDDFYARIAAGTADIRPVDSADAAEAVFRVLSHYVDPGQIAKVQDALPEDVRRLWRDLQAQGFRLAG